MVISSGEIKSYEVKDSYKRHISNLKKTFEVLKWRIRDNFQSNACNQLHITLTYKDRNIDRDRLYKDFKRFMTRLRRHLADHKLDYIAICEPQADGTWHIHTLLKTDKQNLYLHNDTIVYPMWGQGFTKTKAIKCNDIGSYFTAYFTDITVPKDEGDYNVTTEDINGKAITKGVIKGGRLHYYPKNFKFYRCSRGITDPSKNKEYKFLYELLEIYGNPSRSIQYNIMKVTETSEIPMTSMTKLEFKKK